MPSKGLPMGSETTGRKTPQRARLSDITNTVPLSISKRREDDHVSKGCETQLHKELANLRKALAEKEQLVQAQKVNMERLWTNYTRKTKQNEDIIQKNGRLYKDLMQARDRLKILQHENAQMASAHKAVKSELQAQLAKALMQADLSQKVAGPLICEKGPCDKQANFPNLLTKLAESRARRTVSSCEASNELLDMAREESSEHSATCRSTLRRRSSLSYKEPSLKMKLRQPESATSSQVKSSYQRENQIHQLQKVCEEESKIVSVVMPCSIEDKVAETLLPTCSQAASQTKSAGSLSALSFDLLEDQNSSSSAMPEGSILHDLKSGEQRHRQLIESSSSLAELQSGRPCRRSSVGSIISYKEAPLNTKLRRPS